MRIHFRASSTPDAQSLLKEFQKTYGAYHLESADFIVVLGGDGTMLDALHTTIVSDIDIPLFGINYGSVGFLMNPKQNYNLPDVISHSHGIKVPALEMTSPNQSKKIYAFNEVSLLRQTRQIAHLRVIIDGVERLSNYRGDGILLSTPMGSTAYNSSCGGPILPINSQVLALTPLSPFKPRHMKSAILGNSSVVQIINEDAPKRPVSATADSTEVRDIENITIRLSNISRTLLFDPDYNLAEKIISEQFEY